MESAEAIAVTVTVAVQSAPVTVSVFWGNHAMATIIATVVAGADHSSFLRTLAIFLPAAIAALIAFLSYRFLRREKQYKAADLFCVNMEKYINDYFEATAQEERMKCATKCNVHLQGFVGYIYDPANRGYWERLRRLLKIPIKGKGDEFYPYINTLMDIDEDTGENDIARMRNALSAVVQIKSLLTRW